MTVTDNLTSPACQNFDIKIENLTLAYDDNVVYQNFSHTFQANKVHVILGKSGCGKTSLLNAIAGFVPCDGQIDAGKLSYVFQQPRLAQTTLFNNVEMVLLGVIPDKIERAKVVAKYLKLAELSVAGSSPVATLSGGEQQRVSLARAFAYPSNTLLMDEPFKSLDLGIRKKLYQTLNNLLCKQPRTTLLVTHDVDEALSLADTIYLLADKPCILTKITDISTPRNQRNLYDEQFLQLRKQLEQLL